MRTAPAADIHMLRNTLIPIIVNTACSLAVDGDVFTGMTDGAGIGIFYSHPFSLQDIILTTGIVTASRMIPSDADLAFTTKALTVMDTVFCATG